MVAVIPRFFVPRMAKTGYYSTVATMSLSKACKLSSLLNPRDHLPTFLRLFTSLYSSLEALQFSASSLFSENSRCALHQRVASGHRTKNLCHLGLTRATQQIPVYGQSIGMVIRE